MSVNDLHLATHASNHLDLAFLSFFEQFRKIYIGDSIQKNSQVCCHGYSSNEILVARYIKH